MLALPEVELSDRPIVGVAYKTKRPGETACPVAAGSDDVVRFAVALVSHSFLDQRMMLLHVGHGSRDRAILSHCRNATR